MGNVEAAVDTQAEWKMNSSDASAFEDTVAGWGQGQAWGELEPLILKGHKNIIYLDVWWKVEQFEVPW